MSEKTFREMGIDAYPLCWPEGWKRLQYYSRKKSRFSVAFSKARNGLFHELRLMGVHDSNVILSTNVALRRDGLPYANLAQPADPGVAVYFKYKLKPMVFACDNYTKVEDNLYAITKTIEAIRGIQRWGASDMMERTFTGFEALPPPIKPATKKSWWEILGIPKGSHPDRIKEVYLALAKIHHPDKGGDPAKMSEINSAYQEGINGDLF